MTADGIEIPVATMWLSKVAPRIDGLELGSAAKWSRLNTFLLLR